jgi:hypothetical protein
LFNLVEHLYWFFVEEHLMKPFSRMACMAAMLSALLPAFLAALPASSLAAVPPANTYAALNFSDINRPPALPPVLQTPQVSPQANLCVELYEEASQLVNQPSTMDALREAFNQDWWQFEGNQAGLDAYITYLGVAPEIAPIISNIMFDAVVACTS